MSSVNIQDVKGNLSGPNSVTELYGHFLKFIGLRKFIFLQVIGLLAAFLNSLGVAGLFPILGILMTDKESFLNTYVYPYVDRQYIPAFISAHLLISVGSIVIFAYALKVFFVVAYCATASRWLEAFTGEMRIRVLRKYETVVGKLNWKDEKSRLLHLSNKLSQLTSYNWAIFESQLKIYNVIFVFCLLLLLSTKLMVGVFAAGVAILAILTPFFQWTRRTANRYFFVQQDLQKMIRNFVEGVETVLTLNAIRLQYETLATTNKKIVSHELRLAVSRQVVASLPELLVIAGIFGVMGFVSTDSRNLPLLITYGFAITRFLAVLNEAITRFNNALEVKKSSDEVFTYLADADQREQDGPSENLVDVIKDISFQHVSVRIGSEVLLSDVSLDLEAGRIYQIIGKNGSGKSTLLKCLLKLVPYDGVILINNQRLTQFRAESIYEKIAYHNQNPYIFSGSIFENLSFGNPSLTFEAATKLCKTIGMTFAPLDFRIEEDGKNLSGGEKQIICLARTLLRDAEIYVLDEFTNHLGRDVVEKVFSYISSQLGKTFFVISHQVNFAGGQKIFLERGKLKYALGLSDAVNNEVEGIRS